MRWTAPGRGPSPYDCPSGRRPIRPTAARLTKSLCGNHGAARSLVSCPPRDRVASRPPGIPFGDERDGLAPRGRSRHQMAGHPRPCPGVAGRRGSRASPSGARGLGRAAPRARGRRRALGRWRVLPASYTGGEPGQPWTATMHTLQTLQLLGLDPASESARRAIALFAENGRWEHEGQRYFDGEVEPCINGRTVETGAYFGVDVAAIVERLLGERLEDGGWNCEAENGSVRSSFDTTINVLDGLLEFERATGGSAEVRTARRGGEEYLLERGCTAARAPRTSSTRRTSTSRSRTTGTTTCCERSTTSAGREQDRTPGWRRRSPSCDRSDSPTAVGCSTASIPAGSTSTSRAAWGRRAAGTPPARSGSSIGGTARPDAFEGRVGSRRHLWDPPGWRPGPHRKGRPDAKLGSHVDLGRRGSRDGQLGDWVDYGAVLSQPDVFDARWRNGRANCKT